VAAAASVSAHVVASAQKKAAAYTYLQAKETSVHLQAATSVQATTDHPRSHLMSRGLLSSLAANSVQSSASVKQKATSVPSPAAHPKSHPKTAGILSSLTAKSFQPSTAHLKSHPKTADFSRFLEATTLRSPASVQVSTAASA
jgi:hypothetical protein